MKNRQASDLKVSFILKAIKIFEVFCPLRNVICCTGDQYG